VIGHRAIGTLDYDQLVARRIAEKSAEEQRIFYVAMTRARERLILSGAAKFASWSDASPLAWIAPTLVPDLAVRTARGDGGVALISGSGGVPVRLTLSSAAQFGDVLRRASPGAAVAGEAVAGETVAGEAATAAESARAAVDSAPAQVSYSSLADYERCGYRYYLQRVVGLGDVASPAARAVSPIAADVRGVVVHALLERIDFVDPGPPDAATTAAVARACGTPIESAADIEEVMALTGAFAASPLCERLARAREVRREAPFAFTLDGVELLRGFTDVAATEADGTLLVIDYKTDLLAAADDLAARVERDYAVQRLVYALAALHTGAPRVEVAHCFLRRPLQSPAAIYGAEDRASLEAELRARLAPLRAGRFEVTPAPRRELCANCPGRARLCSHSDAMTLREEAASWPPSAP
jgi:ATP-dependent exoDNAse (exonuclease V) beta subunit